MTTELIRAVLKNDLCRVMELIDSSADINLCDAKEISPLYAATTIGDVENNMVDNTQMVKYLIQKGANINHTNYKCSPIHFALFVNNVNIANILIKNGAIINKAIYDNIIRKENDRNTCIVKNCRNEKEFICSQCNIVSYCSAACQKKDWCNHKKICKYIIKLNTNL